MLGSISSSCLVLHQYRDAGSIPGWRRGGEIPPPHCFPCVQGESELSQSVSPGPVSSSAEQSSVSIVIRR